MYAVNRNAAFSLFTIQTLLRFKGEEAFAAFACHHR
jgi:hypothetical protein